MRKDLIDKVTRFYKDRQMFYSSLRKDGLKKAKENKEIVSIEERLKEIKLLALQGKLNPEIDKEYDVLQKKFLALVDNYLPKIKYECEICKDTGIVDGKYCKCFTSRYIDELKKSSNISLIPSFSFADRTLNSFDLSSTDLARYEKIYDRLQNFADSYPDCEYFNIFLRGHSGSGKTCIVSAVANRLIERGFSVQYITAFDFSELMLSNHLDYKDKSLTTITDAEILVIDDIGSEPMRENINKTYMQSILDSRIARRKPTIITTNLTSEQLMKRYGERIISRLTNKNDTYSVDFGTLPNLRITKKLK